MRKVLLRAGGALLASGFWLLAGCGTSVSSEDAPCSGDGDCAANEVCEPLAEAKRSANVARPCFTNYMSCSDDSSCSGGLVCWPSQRVATIPDPACFAPPTICGPKCPTTACTSDEVCEESGHCRVTQCDEAGAPSCPAHWVCEPTAMSEPRQSATGAVDDSPSYLRDIERGCVRLRCDEPGGLTCRDNWSCDPENATDPSGCRPLSCAESGQCSDDAIFICEPTNSAAPRPTGVDVHGCVARNCDEGFACDASSTCDPGTGEPSLRGCRLLNCEEGVTCGVSQYCDPSDPTANVLGCVYVPPEGSGGTGSGGGSGAAAGTNGGGAPGTGGSGNAGRTGSGGVSSSGGAASSGGSSGSASAGSGATGASGASSGAITGRCVAR